jgi:hypothetical protein
MPKHTSSSIWNVTLVALVAGAIAIGNAQGQQAGAAQNPPPAPTTPQQVVPPAGATHAVNAKDPRVGLKSGMDDAGTAIHGLELVSHMGKPEAFTNVGGNLDFANSDFAFQGPHLFLGNFHGLNFYNVEDPRRPQLRVSVPCPGGQGDVSVYGKLLFMSVEQGSGRVDCGPQGVSTPVSMERFRGVRIFDISDVENPKQIAAVQTCRGSHTHTLVVPPNATDVIYVYGSGTAGVRSGDELAGCTSGSSTDDPNSSLFSIDVIQVPLKAPETAKIVNRPRIFADPSTGAIAGLWMGGTHGDNTQRTSTTNQCHDITTYPAIGLAAGACSGNGILLDISDPVNPKRLDAVVDKNFAYWHSASFNNDGTKVIFTDEWGGGTAPRCRATDLLTWGADAVFNIVDKKLVFGGYYKMPAPQTDQENCVAHNGSLVPVPGRDIMVQAWYQGGLSMFDFTDAAHPVEIAYFDRGPIDEKRMLIGGYWSTYYYNGHIYGSEIYRGPGHLHAGADRTDDAERDRRGRAREEHRAERPASAEDHVAGELRRSEGVPGSARPEQDDHRRAREQHRDAMDRAEKGDGLVKELRARADRFDGLAAGSGRKQGERRRCEAPQGCGRSNEGPRGTAQVISAFFSTSSIEVCASG